jgi:hypothetical protein
MKMALFLLLLFLLFGSCMAAPERTEFNYNPPVESWLVYFESGRLSGEEFLCLVRGSFAVKEMEALKIMTSRRERRRNGGTGKKNQNENGRSYKLEGVMRYIPIIFSAFLLAACASTGAVVPPPIERAGEYQELQGELYQQQADIAVAGQKIEDQGRGLVDDLTRLEEVIAAAPDAGEAGHLVQAVRVKAEDHVADIERLNQQLAVERETVKRQDQKFNEYETAMTGELSAKGTENSRLREEVKTVKGQRNTLLAIVSTAGVVILCFVVFKVLRFFRVIPI